MTYEQLVDDAGYSEAEDRARRAGRKVDEFVGQTDMFSGDAVSPMGRGFLALMFRDAPKSYARATGVIASRMRSAAMSPRR